MHSNDEAPRDVVLLAGGDLGARARVLRAANQAGLELVTSSIEGLLDALQASTVGVLIIDLDEAGAAGLAALNDARARGSSPERVLGFYSHVDDRLGERARATGCEALPRGRFWRTLPQLLGG